MTSIPTLPRILGFAGLLPQLACLLVLWVGPPEWRFAALAIAWGYAALILAFLGGLWWGIAASQLKAGRAVPAWLWIWSIVPPLFALLTYLPWVFGQSWPEPALVMLGIALIASLVIDRRIAPSCPDWWMRLRVPLSLGLGLASIAIAVA